MPEKINSCICLVYMIITIADWRDSRPTSHLLYIIIYFNDASKSDDRFKTRFQQPTIGFGTKPTLTSLLRSIVLQASEVFISTQ